MQKSEYEIPNISVFQIALSEMLKTIKKSCVNIRQDKPSSDSKSNSKSSSKRRLSMIIEEEEESDGGY